MRTAANLLGIPAFPRHLRSARPKTSCRANRELIRNAGSARTRPAHRRQHPFSSQEYRPSQRLLPRRHGPKAHEITFGLGPSRRAVEPALRGFLGPSRPRRRRLQTVNLLMERNIPVTFYEPEAGRSDMPEDGFRKAGREIVRAVKNRDERCRDGTKLRPLRLASEPRHRSCRKSIGRTPARQFPPSASRRQFRLN